MTTWCRPDRASTSTTNRRGSSCLVVGANKRHHGRTNHCNYPSDQPTGENLESESGSTRHHRHQQSASRHSIADILGWSHGAAIKIENETTTVGQQIGQLDLSTTSHRLLEEKQQQHQQQQRHYYYQNNDHTDDEEEEDEEEDDDEEDEEEEELGMASDYVDVADMVISDEPLDLSLDKSKCRRERERENSGTPIKRAKVVVDAIEPASDGGTDEADMDVGPWGNVQPHLQMAANFSTVLQYYLTAARLWQTSEVIRCQESQQRVETDSEANEAGDDGHASDTTAAVVAAVAAAAAAESSMPVQSQSNNKRRKKDHLAAVAAAAELAASAGDSANGSRPRKTRTTFTGKQLFELERIFEQKKYLSSNERQEVARLLNVTGSQVSFHRFDRLSTVVLLFQANQRFCALFRSKFGFRIDAPNGRNRIRIQRLNWPSLNRPVVHRHRSKDHRPRPRVKPARIRPARPPHRPPTQLTLAPARKSTATPHLHPRHDRLRPSDRPHQQHHRLDKINKQTTYNLQPTTTTTTTTHQVDFLVHKANGVENQHPIISSFRFSSLYLI